VLALFAVPSFAQDEEALEKDLTAVIALQGLPCGQVVTVKEQAESDFAVSCKDGQLYRVSERVYPSISRPVARAMTSDG